MAEQAIRTVVLARDGAACDRIVEGLVEAGAHVLQTVDPTLAAPAAVEALSPQAVVVALEPAVEDALDAFQPLLSAPGVMVLFEEAALVLERTGWDAARWVRHLAAKLHGLQSALPPGTEDADEAVPPAPATSAEAGGELEAGAPSLDGYHAFDPVTAESGAELPDAPSLQLTGLDLELEPADASDRDIAIEAQSASAFDPVSAEFDAAPAGPDNPQILSFDLDFELADTDDIAYAPPVADLETVAGFEPREFEIEPRAAATALDAADAETTPAQTPPVGLELDELDGSTLQLLDPDTLPLAGDPAAGAHRPSPAVAGRDPLDLAALETRIAGLSLADTDSYGHGPRRGVVLVEGGLGGPDAVRQLLGAIPEGFPRPILVRLQLDGGRYDRLVRQMERATSLPVQLAEAGMSVVAGEVYFLPPDLLPALSGGELRFAEQGDLASLADAVPPDDSALLFLSGADSALVDVAMGPGWQGALVAGQSDDGCYDSVAAHAVAARGGPSGRPDEIADWLLARWMPDAHPSDPGPGGLSL